MKILLVVNGFPPFEVGGTEVLARNTARELTRLGNQVIVFAPTFSGQYEGDSLLDGVRIHRVLVSPEWQYRGSESYMNLAVEDLFEEFASEIKPDVGFVLHTVNLSAGIPKILSRLGIPHMLFLSDFYFYAIEFT